ncbi:hypothetical protein OAB94_02100 [Flavobacteriaceae bacterium]|nr:hypothetical protein [Flavobacteriaceae bacterium]
MIKLILIGFIFMVVTVNCSWFPPNNDTSCEYTRADALACIEKYGDLDKDTKLTNNEINHAISALVPMYIRVGAFFKGINLNRVMKDCDYDHDGVLTPRDWELSKKTCMPRKQDLCKFKWFCDNVK